MISKPQTWSAGGVKQQQSCQANSLHSVFNLFYLFIWIILESTCLTRTPCGLHRVSAVALSILVPVLSSTRIKQNKKFGCRMQWQNPYLLPFALILLFHFHIKIEFQTPLKICWFYFDVISENKLWAKLFSRPALKVLHPIRFYALLMHDIL